MTFKEWLQKRIGISVSNADEVYQNDARLRGLYEDFLKSEGKQTYGEALNDYQSGRTTAIDFQGVLANNGIPTSPEQTQWLNNEISQQVTNEARDYNTQMRDSDLTSAASQLQSLGLNPASVLQTGGSGTGSSGMTADTSKGNPAQEKMLADFHNKAALTRTIIGLVGGLGSAGILGSSRLLAQKAAGVAASAAAHSGLNFIKHDYGINDRNYEKKWNKLLQDLDF